MKRITARVALCLLLLLPFSAWADDIVSTWRHQNGTTMELSMRDANHVRMDSGKDRYILLRKEKVYMVFRQDGQWTAVDMDVLAGMMNQFGIRAGGASAKDPDYRSTFRNTGRTETVAGYKGTVWVAETKDAAGKLIDSSEVVFSKHRDVVLAGKAWMRIASRMGDIIGARTSQEIEKAARQSESSGYGGMLRVGEMTLVGIRKPSLENAYFDLPAGAEIVDADALSNQAEKSGDTAPGPNFAEELGQAAGEAAREQAEQNTAEEVRKSVDGLFKKIFK